MKHINATILLPDGLVKDLQNYIQGGYIYVPTIQEQQKHWENYPAIVRNYS